MRKFVSVVVILVMLFALAVPAFAAEGSSVSNANKGTSANTSVTSPQTGVDATAYIMVTATLVLFAGFCFVKARKVTE